MSVKTWVLAKVFDRLRVGPDVTKHLSTLQRLGEEIDLQVPTELLVVGARQAFRAIRTRAAVQISPDWVWPYWIEAQLDRHSSAFIPRGHLPVLANVTHRNWTAVGTLDSRFEAIVDPHGLVTPWFDGPSLDWWVRGPAGWQFPSRAGDMRQSLLDATPVVCTTMPVAGGGQVTSTVYGAAGSPDTVVASFTNETEAPVALALAVRPYNPEGLAVVERLAVDADTVLVDGAPFLWLLANTPREVRLSTFRDGDVAASLTEPAGAGTERRRGGKVDDPAGLATAALVFPLAHGTTLTVVLPLGPAPAGRRGRPGPPPTLPSHHRPPAPAAVARGWKLQTARPPDTPRGPGAPIAWEFPDERASAAMAAQAGYLLLLHDGDAVTPGPYTYHRFWFRDAAFLLRAMGHLGLHAEVASVLRSYPGRQQRDGFFFSQPKEWDSNGAAITAVADHWRFTHDRVLLDELLPSIRRGVSWIHTMIRSSGHDAPAVAGLLPPGVSAEHLGPFDYYYWDDFVSLRGLLDAAELARAAGDDSLLTLADATATRLRGAIDRSLETVEERLGVPLMPAGPNRRLDPGTIGSLASCYPLGLLAPDDRRVVATRDAVLAQFCDGPRYFQGISHTGYGTYLTLHLAGALLLAGDQRAWDFAAWLLDAATPTWTWPEAIHPQVRGGCMGDGHHGWAAAELVSFLRNMCVREVPGGLALCTLFPDAWRVRDRPLRLQSVPTAYGRLDLSVQWDGDEAVVQWRGLWGKDRPVLTAPGLDPAWSTNEEAGVAALRVAERVVQPAERAAEVGANTSRK